MATIFTHPIVPVAAAYLIGRDKIPTRLLVAAGIASVIPDFDVIGLQYGISYGDQFGHRGFTHSIFFALMMAIIASLSNSYLLASKNICFWMVFIGCCSHGMLDAFTDGGRGIVFFWPITAERYFFPWQPIEVSPIGLSRFLTPRGLDVLISEFWIVWIPAGILMILGKRMSSNPN